MKINELQIGDWVYESESTQFPMFVIGTFNDIINKGVVYLDFNGNEGDIWEVDIDEILSIPITEEFLLKNGFKKNTKSKEYEQEIDNCFIRIGHYSNRLGCDWSIHVDNNCFDSILYCDFQYVHELQNAMRMAGIEWEVKI